jgi:hypothetical protein
LRYFPHFTDLAAKVEGTLDGLAGKPDKPTTPAGEYRELTPTVS